MTLPAKQPETRCIAPSATDGELLMQFVRHRDQAAISELVHKHASLVMAVCRQILGSGADADDAFQATFLILVKRGGTIEHKSSVAGWLYRVAYRTAMRLAARRRRNGAEPLVAEPVGEPEVFSIIHEREVRRTLHEELDRLPSRYREPILLHYFAGKTREEIAEELECTEAAVKGRLARGRKALRIALARRGVGLSVAIGVAVAASASSSPAAAALSDKTALACASTLKGSANTDFCSSDAIQLAQEGVRAMLFSTLTKFVVAPAVVGVALVAFAQLPDRTGDYRVAAGATGELLLADDAAASFEPAGGVSTPAVEAGPAVIVSSPSGIPPATVAPPVATNDPAARPANPLQQTQTPEAQPDAETAQMLAAYYERRAEASDTRADAKRVEIQAYGTEAADEREKLLREARQLELHADVMELLAESELFSKRAKLLRERREGQATVPAGRAASTTALAGTEDSVTTLPPAIAARATDTIQPGDRLMIEAKGVFPDEPIAQEYVVEQGGTVPLGPTYGRVSIGGLNLVEAGLAIEEYLEEDFVQNPEVQVTRADTGAVDAELQSLRAEIRSLRAELEELRSEGAAE